MESYQNPVLQPVFRRVGGDDPLMVKGGRAVAAKGAVVM